MTKNVAIVDEESGLVINVAVMPDQWTGAEGEWRPEKGFLAIPAEDAHIGDAYEGGVFIRSVIWNDDAGQPVPMRIDISKPPAAVAVDPAKLPPRKPKPKDQIADLEARIAKMESERHPPK